MSNVLGLQEVFECFGAVEFAQDTQLFFARRAWCAYLDVILNPLTFSWILDVHVFHTDGAAIAVAQDSQNLAELHAWLSTKAAGRKIAIQVPQRESVVHDIKVRM